MNSVILSAASCTNVGRRRASNEDAVLASRPVFMVADGMGGHEAGGRASSIAVQEMSRLNPSPSIEDVGAALARARRSIDQIHSGGPQRAAGTTVSGVVLVEQAGRPYWLVINLGDSRTYLVVNGQLHQVSVDHSEAQELIEAGRLDRGIAGDYARRHVLTRVLGAQTRERPDYWLIPVLASQRWMICSDGVSEELDDARIAQILTGEPSPQGAADSLVAAALDAGGRDNISVVVVDVESGGPQGDDETVEEIIALRPARLSNHRVAP